MNTQYYSSQTRQPYRQGNDYYASGKTGYYVEANRVVDNRNTPLSTNQAKVSEKGPELNQEKINSLDPRLYRSNSGSKVAKLNYNPLAHRLQKPLSYRESDSQNQVKKNEPNNKTQTDFDNTKQYYSETTHLNTNPNLLQISKVTCAFCKEPVEYCYCNKNVNPSNKTTLEITQANQNINYNTNQVKTIEKRISVSPKMSVSREFSHQPQEKTSISREVSYQRQDRNSISREVTYKPQDRNSMSRTEIHQSQDRNSISREYIYQSQDTKLKTMPNYSLSKTNDQLNVKEDIKYYNEKPFNSPQDTNTIPKASTIKTKLSNVSSKIQEDSPYYSTETYKNKTNYLNTEVVSYNYINDHTTHKKIPQNIEKNQYLTEEIYHLKDKIKEKNTTLDNCEKNFQDKSHVL